MFLIEYNNIIDTIKDIILKYFSDVIYCDSFDITMNKYGVLYYCIAQNIFKEQKFPISQKTYDLYDKLDSLLPSSYFKYDNISFKNILSSTHNKVNHIVTLDQFEEVLNLLNCKTALKSLNEYKKNNKKSSLISFFATRDQSILTKKEMIGLFDYYMNQYKEFLLIYNDFISSFYTDQILLLKEKLAQFDIKLYIFYNEKVKDSLNSLTFFSQNNIPLKDMYFYKDKKYYVDILLELKKIENENYPFLSMSNSFNLSYYEYASQNYSIDNFNKKPAKQKLFYNLSKELMYKVIFQLYTNIVNIDSNNLSYRIGYIQLPFVPNIVPLLGFEYNDEIYKITYHIHSNLRTINDDKRIVLKNSDIRINKLTIDNEDSLYCFDYINVMNIINDILKTLPQEINEKSKIHYQYRDTKMKFNPIKQTTFNIIDFQWYNELDVSFLFENVVSIDCNEFQYKLYQLLYYKVWSFLLYDKSEIYNEIRNHIKEYLIEKIQGESFDVIKDFCNKNNYTYQFHVKYYKYNECEYDKDYTYRLCNLFESNQINQLFKPDIDLPYIDKKIIINLYINIFDEENQIINASAKSNAFYNLNDTIVQIIQNKPQYSEKEIKKLRKEILQIFYKYYYQDQIVGMVNCLYRESIMKILKNLKNITNNINAISFDDFFTQLKYYIGEEKSYYMIKYKEI